MRPDEAAWVRDNAWTKTMRQTYQQVPAHFTHCACQLGICGACSSGRHKHCPHKQYAPFPSPECYITTKRQQVLAIPGGFVHPERTATGWHRGGAAMVWLVDRRCVWVCPCCGVLEPQPVTLVPTGTRRRADPEGQTALFDRFTTR